MPPLLQDFETRYSKTSMPQTLEREATMKVDSPLLSLRIPRTRRIKATTKVLLKLLLPLCEAMPVLVLVHHTIPTSLTIPSINKHPLKRITQIRTAGCRTRMSTPQVRIRDQEGINSPREVERRGCRLLINIREDRLLLVARRLRRILIRIEVESIRS